MVWYWGNEKLAVFHYNIGRKIYYLFDRKLISDKKLYRVFLKERILQFNFCEDFLFLISTYLSSEVPQTNSISLTYNNSTM